MPSPSGRSPRASHYEILEVAPDASPQQLRQAFRSLSKRYHPDTTSLPAPEAEEAFRRLQQAYTVLGDPLARELYDRQLREPPIRLDPPVRPAVAVTSPQPASVRRALSGGEWFALLLLGLAMLLSLVLGIGLAWARGTELIRQPSWWADLAAQAPAGPPAAVPASPPAGAPVRDTAAAPTAREPLPPA